MLNKKSVDDINVKGKKVLVRCDFNVPLKDGKITDENRLVAALPTIRKLIKDGGKVILCSHLGKPKGEPKPELSLAPVAVRLSELLGQEVKFAADANVVGDNAKAAVAAMKDGDVVLLENTRYRAEETKNGEAFSKELASLADVFVNDAFGTAHRAHCSNVGVTKYVDTAVVGYLMQKEIDFLGNAVNSPERPFVAILGGAKVADKLNVISNLLEKCDTLIIGGGMAYTFLKAKGYEIGKSLVDDSKIDYCKEMMEKAEKLGKKLLLPVDTVMIEDFPNPIDAPVDTTVCAADQMDASKEGCDIGPKTVELYSDAVKTAKTVVWNGPMGVFENPTLAAGTKAVAAALAETDAITIIGGGDSAAAVNQLGYGDKMSHISTGGGASLEYLEGKVLPGVAALDDLRRKMIAGNWKMHKTVSEAVELAEDIVMETNGTLNEVVIFPPFTALETVADAIDGKHVGYGAQDLHWEDKGAFTGAVSGAMIADICAEYVLVGHSERRTIFGENEKIVASKIIAAYRNGLKPMLCVGENLAEREAGKTARKINMQLKSALRVISAEDAENLVVAYEPIWAIGSGKAATPEDALEVCTLIREKIGKIFTPDIARKVRILYGGSVNEKNAASFNLSGIDGVLVGGASLKADTFAAIVRSF